MYKNPADPDNFLLKSKIKEWIAQSTGETIFSFEAKEAGCNEERCPCIQTSIQFNNHFIQIGKPLVFIRKWDIDAILSLKN